MWQKLRTKQNFVVKACAPKWKTWVMKCKHFTSISVESQKMSWAQLVSEFPGAARLSGGKGAEFYLSHSEQQLKSLPESFLPSFLKACLLSLTSLHGCLHAEFASILTTSTRKHICHLQVLSVLNKGSSAVVTQGHKQPEQQLCNRPRASLACMQWPEWSPSLRTAAGAATY